MGGGGATEEGVVRGGGDLGWSRRAGGGGRKLNSIRHYLLERDLQRPPRSKGGPRSATQIKVLAAIRVGSGSSGSKEQKGVGPRGGRLGRPPLGASGPCSLLCTLNRTTRTDART